MEIHGNNLISRTYHYYKKDRTKPNDFAVISGDYKYIYNLETAKKELYHLRNDIAEKENLIDSFRNRQERRNLKCMLKSWIEGNKVKVAAPSEEALKNEEDLNKRLRSLGYVR